ncbi:hypothetical protein [Tateyamaria sp. SN3-11]|uniref:hypothetical protein n=1 Tax=Tateyamaria sp. SN3-11 TaxID=3092147 RepID=UPI0039ED09CB
MTASQNIYEDFGGVIRLLNDLDSVFALAFSLFVATCVYRWQKREDRRTQIAQEVRSEFAKSLQVAAELKRGCLGDYSHFSDTAYENLMRDFMLLEKKLFVLGEVEASKKVSDHSYSCFRARSYDLFRDFGGLSDEDEMRQAAAQIDEVENTYKSLSDLMQNRVRKNAGLQIAAH